jgi:chemotaxis protein MotB
MVRASARYATWIEGVEATLRERNLALKISNLSIVALCLVSFAVALSAGCVSKGKYNSAMAERDALAQERDSLAAVAAEQGAELDALQADYDRLAVIFADEITNKELQLRRLANGIEVAIPSDLMYESGSATATIGSEGIEHAMTLADFLRGTDYFISVVGHTDSQQPSPALAEKYPTNWELAGARAAGAVKFFVSQGIEPTRLVAVSKGEFEPVASNDTAEGRAENRRIQIILRSLPE